MDVDLPGSSPLARGLPRRRVGVRPAGQDHPRSRGVYGGAAALGPVGPGSSPLARGLLHGICVSIKETGIIPARAGFTPGLVLPPAEVEDHPRSRGVYRQPSKTWRPTRGSSPLARGLLRRRPGRVGEQRIIPARAGFTVSAAGGVRRTRDHPRSRGVYSSSARSPPSRVGSSPLARGLLQFRQVASQSSWIIPARAGFTPPLPLLSARPPDHPRSRGVYSVRWEKNRVSAGSSPLARGLRVPLGRAAEHVRIIPARAGFTRSCPPAGRGCWDHPRSRGVYYGGGVSEKGFLGSSPLARGLPLPRPGLLPGGGIIPARAGFTVMRNAIEKGEEGSSPLARGLRTAAIAG